MNVLQPEDVGLILSYTCSSACRHCLYNCSPDWQDWMEPDKVRLALEMMQRAWGHGFQVHITGGEPFLNFPLLLHAVATAAELHIPRYVETNAAWCVHSDLVRRRFFDLREAGLQAILISCSPFHAESIPLSRTLLAIEVAVEVFGSERVMVYQPEWVEQIFRFGAQEPVPLERYVQAFGAKPAGLMLWQGYGLISGGRAGEQLGHLAERQPAEAFQNDNCRPEILFAPHSHLDLYGNFIPHFCSGLSLGEWGHLQEIREKAEAQDLPPLLRILAQSGPYGLMEMAQQADDQQPGQYQPLKSGYAGKCHLCADIRRYLFAHGDYPELKPMGFYRLEKLDKNPAPIQMPLF